MTFRFKILSFICISLKDLILSSSTEENLLLKGGMEGGGSSSSSKRKTTRGLDEGSNSNLQVIMTVPPPFSITRKRRHTQNQASQTSQVSLGLLKSVKLNQEPDLHLATFMYDLCRFPESLLLEILIRVPLKLIFRFKCVSKHWHSLISHPSFARFYVSRRLNASSPFRIFYRYVYVSTFKEVLKRLRPDVYVSPKFSVLFLSTFEEQQQSDQFKILAVSNGLFMCCLLGPLIYYVCDPVTRQFLTLPRGSHNSPNRHPMFFGEGLVSKINEHNVLTSFKAVRVEWLSMESSFLNLETFSSETGTWTEYRLTCPKRIRMLKRGGGPIHCNGILHWFVYDHGMVAFDPYSRDTKECRLIQFPDGRDTENEYKHDGLYRLCDECQGKLRYFEVASEPLQFFCFSMWVLNDYEKGEWLLEFQVTRSDLWSDDDNLNSQLPCATFIPLSFHPLDKDVVYLRCVEHSCIVSYNIRAKRMDVTCESIGVVEDLSWRVVAPVVLPIWPRPLPYPAKKALKRISIN